MEHPSGIPIPESSKTSLRKNRALTTSEDDETKLATSPKLETLRSSSRTARSGSKGKQFTRKVVADFQLGEELGKGAMGTVYKALNLKTGTTVALKRVELKVADHATVESLLKEVELLKTMSHPNIVGYLGFLQENNCINIVLEYVENGSLEHMIRKYGPFPEDLVRLYLNQVLNGLQYLHAAGIVHHDIKAANILLTKTGKVKLADFGIASKLAKDHRPSNEDKEFDKIGSPFWLAPEVIQLAKGSMTETASDIWSVGCCIIELLTGYPPFWDLGALPALFAMVEQPRPPFPEDVTEECEDFLIKCFQRDPRDRPTAEVLVRHEWVTNDQLNTSFSSDPGGKPIIETVLPSENFDIKILSKEVKVYNHRRSVLLEQRKTLRGRTRSNSPLALLVTPSKDIEDRISKLSVVQAASLNNSLPQSPNTTIKMMDHSAITNMNMVSLLDETYARLNREKIMNLEASFVNLNKNFKQHLYQPSRLYIRDGVLTKICRKSQKKRFFFLFSDLLIYASGRNQRYNFHRMLFLIDTKVQSLPDLPNLPHAFEIRNARKSFVVLEETAEGKQHWLKDLRSCIDKVRTTLPIEQEPELDVEFAPVWLPDEASDNCMRCTKTFSFFIRRHHCRACGSLVCASCSPNKVYLPNICVDHRLRVCSACDEELNAKRKPSFLVPTPSLSASPTSSSLQSPSQPTSPPPNAT